MCALLAEVMANGARSRTNPSRSLSCVPGAAPAPPASALQKHVNRGRLRFVDRMGGSDAARTFGLP